MKQDIPPPSSLDRARELQDALLQIQEHERSQLGSDLHDGLCQHLASIGLLVHSHALQLERAKAAEQLISQAKQIQFAVREAIKEARDVARGLMPAELQSGLIAPALFQLAARLREQHAVECVILCPDDLRLAPDEAVHLYRIVQEPAGNACRHGRANRIEVNVSFKGRRCGLELTDDGVGFSLKSGHEQGMGLRTMSYRAAMLGGTLIIRPGKEAKHRRGTTVSFTFVKRRPS